MALRQLTEADCGQYNPLVQLTTHLTRDHALGENYGSTVFPSSSDQLVEQFLEETRVAPQTFRMDGKISFHISRAISISFCSQI